MELFKTITLLLSLSAVFAYLNHRFIRLPQAIGVMLIALVLSLMLILFGGLHPGLKQYFEGSVASLNFPDVVLKVMLGALLFAGALHVDTTILKK